MTAPRKLLIRADASSELGVGHFMRALALAQAWSDRGGAVTLATSAEAPSGVVARARDEGLVVVTTVAAHGADDGRATRDLARAEDAHAVVADGYSFGAEFQRTVCEAAPLLVIDDNGENAPYRANLVLNQNLHAAQELYRERTEATRLLLGPRYLLLRRDLVEAATSPEGRSRQPAREVGRIVVAMGGTDPRGLTVPTVNAARLAFPGADIDAVVGSSAVIGEVRATVLRDVRDMARVLASADLAICAAGTTAWELAAVGTPMALIITAENQRGHARALALAGAAIDAGEWSSLDVGQLAQRVAQAAAPAVRGRLVEAARALVDGRGAERVAEILWHSREAAVPA